MKTPIHTLASMALAIARRGAGGGAARPSGQVFAVFLLVIAAVSIGGGYQLAHLMSRISEAQNGPQRGAAQLLAIEDELDDAALGFDLQIQEWKDMLLRLDNEERYNAHRKGFMESSVEVQKALRKTQAEMQRIGLGTEEVEQLITEHRALVMKYVSAYGRLDLRRPESFRAADRKVMGVDREFHRKMATVRANVEFLAQQQLSAPAPGTSYLLLGVLGACSLLFMAFVGFAFAAGFLGYGPGTNTPAPEASAAR